MAAIFTLTSPNDPQPQTPSLKDAQLLYIPQLYSAAQADSLLQQLLDELPLSQCEITLFGKRHRIPRLQSWHGDAQATYRYSGTEFTPNPWTPTLLEIKHTVEQAVHAHFNSVLCNWYRHGQDGMGWHSDDEPELGPNPTIASLTLGQPRPFKMQHKQDKSLRWEQTLAHGSLLLMAGSTQHYWRHHIPKSRKPMAGRMNLTFRQVLN